MKIAIILDPLDGIKTYKDTTYAMMVEAASRGHEYLLAYSCKRRHFCPSCHQKRVVEFGEWLCMDVLKKIPHRHFVFSIPKILRRYFLYDRKLLFDLAAVPGNP